MINPPAFLALEAEIAPLSTPYSAGQVVGGLHSLGPVPGYAGLLVKGISIVDEDNRGAAFEVHIFDQPPASIPDQALFNPSYTDLKARLARIQINPGDYETINSLKIAYAGDANLVLPAAGCWIYLVSTGSATFSAGKKVFLRVFVLG
jgi:hypothetical protein